MERRQYRPAAVAVPEWPRVWPLMKRRSTCAEWMANKSWCCFIFPGPLLLFTPFKIPGRHACPSRKHLDISRPVPDKLEHFPRFLIWIFTVFFYYRVLFFFCWGVWRRVAAKQRRGPPLSCRLPSVYLQCSNNQLANAIMISEGMNWSEWDIIPLISAIQLRHGTGLIYRLYIPPLIRTGLFLRALFICRNGT